MHLSSPSPSPSLSLWIELPEHVHVSFSCRLVHGLVYIPLSRDVGSPPPPVVVVNPRFEDATPLELDRFECAFGLAPFKVRPLAAAPPSDDLDSAPPYMPSAVVLKRCGRTRALSLALYLVLFLHFLFSHSATDAPSGLILLFFSFR